MGFQDKPTAERHEAINACVAELQETAKQLKKERRNR